MRIDEGSENQTFIEMLSDEISKKEEELVNLRREILELKDEVRLNDQIIEE